MQQIYYLEESTINLAKLVDVKKAKGESTALLEGGLLE